LATIAGSFAGRAPERLKLELSGSRPGDALLTSAHDAVGTELEGRTGMTGFISTGRRLLTDEAGATAIEYGLLAACIAMAIVLTVSSVGSTVGGIFTRANSDLITYMPAVGP
jgi:pilus assembly protein Flp/PilA